MVATLEAAERRLADGEPVVAIALTLLVLSAQVEDLIRAVEGFDVSGIARDVHRIKGRT